MFHLFQISQTGDCQEVGSGDFSCDDEMFNSHPIPTFHKAIEMAHIWADGDKYEYKSYDNVEIGDIKLNTPFDVYGKEYHCTMQICECKSDDTDPWSRFHEVACNPRGKFYVTIDHFTYEMINIYPSVKDEYGNEFNCFCLTNQLMYFVDDNFPVTTTPIFGNKIG